MKTVNYMTLPKFKTNLKCPRCKTTLFTSDLSDYAFVCDHCDENFYAFEVSDEDSRSFSVYITDPSIQDIVNEELYRYRKTMETPEKLDFEKVYDENNEEMLHVTFHLNNKDELPFYAGVLIKTISYASEEIFAWTE